MSLLTLPAFAWGTASDISASPWTDNGTPGVAAVADPFGATLAYTITDNDAGSAEARLNVVGACTGSLLVFGVAIKAGTATVSTVQVRDQTAGAYKIQASFTWAGADPGTPSMASGTYVGSILLGSGWYYVLMTAAWTSGNSARVELYGASGTAAATGTTSYYLRHLVFTDYLVDAIGDDENRDGSEDRQGPSGVEESWLTGTDYTLNATIRWIPAAPVIDPVIKHQWSGQAEYQGVNDGVAALIRAGRDKNAITFVYDRADCAVATSGYLINDNAKATAEADRQDEKQIAIRLRATVPYGTV